jgi:transcriptional regulator with XRE-family HTH domain
MAKLLSHLIVSMREYRGWSQADLAERAGIEASYVSKLERGLAPNAAGVILAKLATALETSTDFLLGLTNDPAPRPIDPASPMFKDPFFLEVASYWPDLTHDAKEALAYTALMFAQKERQRREQED